jgi:hypothetical protein
VRRAGPATSTVMVTPSGPSDGLSDYNSVGSIMWMCPEHLESVYDMSRGS